MLRGLLKHIRLVLLLGISLFIPFFFAYSVYIDLSEIVHLSSDISFEDPDDEDLSIPQDEFKIFVPTASFNPLPIGTHVTEVASRIVFLLMCVSQNIPVLRC